MKRLYSRFPEIMFIDGTYNVNGYEMSLYRHFMSIHIVGTINKHDFRKSIVKSFRVVSLKIRSIVSRWKIGTDMEELYRQRFC